MVKSLIFKSKLDVLIPLDERRQVNDSNQSKFMQKHFRLLIDEIEEFHNYYEKKSLHHIGIKPEEITEFLTIFNQWMVYINNILARISDKNFFLNTELARFLSWKLPRDIKQIFEIVIISLRDFRSFSMGKYYQSYIDNSLDQISNEIIENKSDLLKLAEEFQLIPISTKALSDVLLKIRLRIAKIVDLYDSLIDLEKVKDDSTKLNEVLLEFKLTYASDRLKIAYGFYNKGIWDKAVGDMRFVLEMTVKYLARVILKDKYWNKAYKEGIEILRINGIIKDEITKKHFSGRDISVYSALSMKGHHADGTSDSNLANSELEARYFMSLTENVIEYLLASFRESKFYESEESDS